MNLQRLHCSLNILTFITNSHISRNKSMMSLSLANLKNNYTIDVDFSRINNKSHSSSTHPSIRLFTNRISTFGSH